MKSKNNKITRIFLMGLFIIVINMVLISNTSATPDADELGCHPEGYEISSDISEITAEPSSTYTLEVTGTGEDVVIDVYEGAMDNDVFTISPSNIIEDNSKYDLDSDTDSIRVELEIEMPEKTGAYTLRILSRGPDLKGKGTPLAELDIEVTVGQKAPLEAFFDHNNYYLAGLGLVFMLPGVMIFQKSTQKRKLSEKFKRSDDPTEDNLNIRKNKVKKFDQKTDSAEHLMVIRESSSNLEGSQSLIMDNQLFEIKLKNMIKREPFGIFLAAALILFTINIFLILGMAMNFIFGMEMLESRELLDLANFQDLGLLIHISLGSIGLFMGIIVVFGAFSNVPREKLKLPVYIMALALTFNFLYGIFPLTFGFLYGIFTPILGG